MIAFGVSALGVTAVIQQEPNHRILLPAWEYLDGRLVRPAPLDREIDAVAARIPSGQRVYVSNDLGTEVVARDTDVIAPAYANYVFFDTASSWTPHGCGQSMLKRGFHLVVQDGQVYLMAR